MFVAELGTYGHFKLLNDGKCFAFSIFQASLTGVGYVNRLGPEIDYFQSEIRLEATF